MFSGLKTRYLERLDVRLTVYYTGILLAIATVLCAFLLYRLHHNLMKQVDKMLGDEIHELVHEIEEECGVACFGVPLAGESAARLERACRLFDEDVTKRRYYPMFFRVLGPAGATIYTSASVRRHPLPPSGLRGSDGMTWSPPGTSARFRIVEDTARIPGGAELVIQMATETKQPAKIFENTIENMLSAFPLLLFLSVGCGMLAARQPRRVIQEIAAMTERITSQNLSERLCVPAANDEVRHLTCTINAMMDRLEKAFSDLRQFTADVSHELRNPLFAFKGEMEVALSQARDAAQYREILHECLERVDFLIRMVNDLFLIARFDARKISLELGYVNFRDVLRDMHEFFLPMAQEKQIDLRMEPGEDVVLLADRTRLPQMISNVLDNAVKFTPAGGTITMQVVGKTAGIEFTVTDTGIGIPPDKLPFIFNRLYQVDASRSGPQRGSGLGLQICKRIVEAHNGTIRAEGNAPTGTRVVIELPRGE